MHTIPEQCETCHADLVVTKLTCTNCGETVEGRYEPGVFSNLPEDDQNFILMFVRVKGNLKELERELDISYWTIRRKLDELVERLMREDADRGESLSDKRLAVLERLRAGDISVDEAEQELERLKQARS